MTAAPAGEPSRLRVTTDGHIRVVRAAADWPDVVPFCS